MVHVPEIIVAFCYKLLPVCDYKIVWMCSRNW